MSASKIVLKFVSISFKIMVLLVVFYSVFTLAEDAYGFGYRVFTEESMEDAPGRDVIVQVTEGMSAYDLAGVLQKKKLVREKELFFAQLELSAYAKDVKPGIYTLNTSMEAKEMMAVLAGKEEKENPDQEEIKE